MAKAITVDNVSVNYSRVVGLELKKIFSRAPGREKYQALKNVSFVVEDGEILGVIGLNGSGKSTLLRTIAGVMKPDSGRVILYGKSVSLLSFGLGLNRELSGRDNIFLSGLLMGFTKKEIEEKYDDIVEFSELGSAIQQPIKTYSSGMKSRLGFSIAAELGTDILLLDEIFSVGDIAFKRKSFAKMNEMITNEKKTVIIVSHNINSLKKLCNRVLWMEKGEVKQIGAAEEVLNAYVQADIKRRKTKKDSSKK